MEKLRHVEVPVVIDTNVLVPSLYRETHILNFILKGNLVPVWNDFILCEALEIIDELAPTYYNIKRYKTYA
jgi:predicted nucleic acid-binding protein